MILESIVSSVNRQGEINFAPIGVHVPGDGTPLSALDNLHMRLYPGSRTYDNLFQMREGVVNLTDDVLTFVNTALSVLEIPSVESACVRAPRMVAAKSIWEFAVSSFDQTTSPAEVCVRVLRHEAFGGFEGFCRARSAILEAAVAATRLPWIQNTELVAHWREWENIVRKTGGERELEALERLRAHFLSANVPLVA